MESTSARPRPNYVSIWLWLVGLAIVSVIASMVLPRTLALSLIFGAAALKALLVALNYMNLRYERAWLCALALVPLILVIILLIALLPDFVLGR